MTAFWDSLYSAAAQNIKPSPIRDMLQSCRKPGMISFAGGMPDPAIFPVEQFAEAASILRTEGRDILQYGATEGYAPLKDFLASWCAPRLGRKVDDDEMLITSGSIQGADLMTLATLNHGEYVITEAPTFLGVTTDMYNHGAKFLCVPCDEDGMLVDRLPALIEGARSEGKTVKFIYTIATFQNPCGATMSLERRKALVRIAREYGVAIFEDDPYGYVRFDGEHLPTLFSLDGGEHVIYAGSFSKILAPGTRVGWCCGDRNLIRKMAVFKQGVDTCTSVVAQALVYQYATLGHLDAFLPKIIAHYRTKRDVMMESFAEYLPAGEARFTKPEGGFFFWLETPNIPVDALFDHAIARNVAVVKGVPFYPNGDGGDHHCRVCFTFASADAIREGVKRLGDAMRELL